MEFQPVLVSLDTVKRQEVRWLWRGRIPRGRLTGLVGDPGIGKSWLALAIAAAVTTGEPLPGEADKREADNVLLLTAEDDLADTVRPRLEDIGADLSRVKVLTAVKGGSGGERFPQLPDDLVRLETELANGSYALVIIDPLNAYLGTSIDTHRDADLRSVLGALAALAQRTGVALLFILHLNKGQRDKAIYRAQGSIAYVAAARAVHLVGVNPDDERERALVCLKSNLGPKPTALAFEITDDGFRWCGESTLTEADLLAPDQGARGPSALDRAKTFLQELLAEGPVEAEAVQAAAREAGIAEKTLQRAKDALGVISDRTGFGPDGRWTWVLPSKGISTATTKTGTGS